MLQMEKFPVNLRSGGRIPMSRWRQVNLGSAAWKQQGMPDVKTRAFEDTL